MCTWKTTSLTSGCASDKRTALLNRHQFRLRPLLDQPNVTLLVNAEVERLETDPSGRAVRRVQVNREGSQEFYEAVCEPRERPWIPNGALPRGSRGRGSGK